MIKRITIWLPPIAWAAVIFAFSGGPFSGERTGGIVEPLLRSFFPWLSDTAIHIIHLSIRKLGHLAEYFVLGLLVMRSLRKQYRPTLSRRHAVIAMALTSLYAMSDELHQALVPGRSASVVDVVIDVIGAIGGSFWLYLRKHDISSR
jgi:VanZ family protein